MNVNGRAARELRPFLLSFPNGQNYFPTRLFNSPTEVFTPSSIFHIPHPMQVSSLSVGLAYGHTCISRALFFYPAKPEVTCPASNCHLNPPQDIY